MDLKKIAPGLLFETKKAHPCGGSRWTVVRTGADCKIKCLTCGRCVNMPPDALLRRVKRLCKENG